ncbi:response regulator transcription factor [Petralouisia muris]|uniref:Response regulator transcription factor n=1 Tax=Petralouisia muris TaxID=3032872 RepID=A0AC61RQM5_9FIRM|nr:response regulator transcription factor [Petralouisia muris]TGY91329.1 response regulator transcription factor [Petralouisia muris]
MGKLIVLSLDESERNIYDKILEIVSEADISIDREVDVNLGEIQIGELVIIPGQHRVLRQGKEVNLTNIEFRILYMLAIHQGITLSKEKIYNYVWNGEYLQDDSNITSHVRRLRKKIENDPSQPEYIQTVRGVGYKINSLKRE